MKKMFVFYLSLIIASFFTSCSTTKGVLLNPPKELAGNFVFIPQGVAFLEQDTVAVKAFWIGKYEVSNQEYVAFLDDLHRQGRMVELSLALPDTLKWKIVALADPYINHYLRHPAYRNYPVVNISHQAAMMYCQWLTDKYNQGSVKGLVYEFRLPEPAQWLSAAQAGAPRPYAWNSIFLRDPAGHFLANFKYIPNEILTTGPQSRSLDLAENTMGYIAFKRNEDGSLTTGPVITNPVNAYYPGVSGLYNLNGNVAEMVQEKGIAVGGSWNCLGYDVRNQAILHYTEPSPFVGFRVVLTVASE